jgi:hypothetical protein
MIRGRVQNGVVLLEDPKALSDGTEVAVKPLRRGVRKAQGDREKTVGTALARLAGQAEGLPADAARNVDHYLYGHAKR